MFTAHFYDDKIDDVAVSYLVFVIIIQLGFRIFCVLFSSPPLEMAKNGRQMFSIVCASDSDIIRILV